MVILPVLMFMVLPGLSLTSCFPAKAGRLVPALNVHPGFDSKIYRKTGGLPIGLKYYSPEIVNGFSFHPHPNPPPSKGRVFKVESSMLKAAGR